MGKALISYASKGDLTNFKNLLSQAPDPDLWYWHVSKALKAAVKNKHLSIVEYCVNELRMSLIHEAFEKYLHLYLFGC
jgi:hypothetical protein